VVAGSTGSVEAGGARAWRCADLGGLDLFRASVSEFAFRPHAHEEFFLALTETGAASPVYRRGRHAIGPGDLIVLNPEEAHAGGPSPGDSWTYRALYPSVDLMREITAEFPAGSRAVRWFAIDVVRDPDIVTLLDRFHRLAESPGPDGLRREACLAEGLTLLAGRHGEHPREPSPRGREPRAVRLALDYLHEHAADNVSLSDLAAGTGLSRYHLCRVFRQATGMTSHAYQIQLRVRRARTLLHAGRPPARVAAEAGSWDHAHLTRHFTRIVGLSPGRYAAGLRA
jgi:AraC-like DNA-binding protein